MSARLSPKRLRTSDANFTKQLDDLLAWDLSESSSINQAAAQIIAQIREQGEAALLALTAQHDALPAQSLAQLTLTADDFAQAHASLPAAEREALEIMHRRIQEYHQHQRQSDWEFEDAHGNRLGQRITALDRVGVYVPGGQASYPSTVLMTAVPAAVAGVAEIVMTVPTPNGQRNALVLAAAHLAGVSVGYTVGGAQAIAALAFGTAGVPRVDKIVGPGGAFVAAAKRLVYGHVGIDAIAGPSEILIIADGSADPRWLALDLFSQAEHDVAAQAILIATDADYCERVLEQMRLLLPAQPRARLIAESINTRGALILSESLAAAVTVANRVAPEHLQLAVAEPRALLPDIRHAGAVFLGARSAEVMGDYAAGPSHVLPTFGTARFSSPLGVYDFQKRSSLIELSEAGADELGKLSALIAEGEGLSAHAQAARVRVRGYDENRQP